MKKLVVLLMVAFLVVAGNVWADPEGWGDAEAVEKTEDEKIQSICPVSLMTNQDRCLRCHVAPSFKVRQSTGFEGHLLEAWMSKENGEVFVNYNLTGAVDLTFRANIIEIREWVIQNPGVVKRVVINGLSGGGGMILAWDIIGVMDDLKNRGITVETRIHGFGASAAFLIFASGSKGHRIAANNALFMWHEVKSFEFFAIKTPGGLEREARIYRKFQDVANEHLASVSDITKEFLDKKIDQDEWWITGDEMKKHGFADRLLR